MSESEERSFWDGRMLPKLPRRSYNAQRQSQSKKVAQPVVESSTSNCVEEQQNDTSVEQGGNGNDVAGGDAEEDHCGGDNVDDNEANSISSFIYPDNDCAGIEEQVRAASVNMTPTSTNSSENVENDRGRKNQTVGDSVGEPPKKREKKVKTEPEIKVEQVEKEYFDKRNVHSHVPLSERFSIAADPKTLIRGDDTVIMPRKQMACNLLTEYKFEDFVKPGLLHDGYYTAVKLEVDESVYKIEGKFCGALTRSAKQEEPCPDNPTLDTELSVSDAWLTTFGGFRGFPENDNLASGVPSCFTAGGENGPKSLGEREHRGKTWDDKSFAKEGLLLYDKEEQAAAVAAEFEAIDALGPKKEDGYVISIMDFSYRITPYYLNTAKMKRVMKSILSNPLLAYDKVLYTRRALLARRRAVEQNSQEYGPEVYFKQLDRTLDESLGPLAVKILERHNPMDITALGKEKRYSLFNVLVDTTYELSLCKECFSS
ncbi:hypothetical protein KIN20_037560 [Parelaphostrongylus tenuis]|uniref:Uncharacterized protein n=1 Tax=Parelaphostrongylus tenuis TaxID=148309 RepID=A0AAD5WM70_PARTN|nr:hypothetical protein KIN20_037560 [Parelaphostrongylus tenuis]